MRSFEASASNPKRHEGGLSSIRRFAQGILNAVADHLIFKWGHRANLRFNQRLLGGILQKSELTFLQRYIHLIFCLIQLIKLCEGSHEV